MGTEMVKKEEYALTSKSTDVDEVVKYNTGGRQVSPYDLEQIKVPTAGQTQWMVTEIGGATSAKELRGIIVHWTEERSYWKDDYAQSGGGTPDCVSRDCETGRGDPGGDCNTCPMAEFGSDQRGTGQACTLRRLLFFIRKDDFMPCIVSVPPGSIGSIHKYFMSLAAKGMKPYQVESVLTLNEMTAKKTKIKFSQIHAEASRKIEGDTLEAVITYSEQIQEVFQPRSVPGSNAPTGAPTDKKDDQEVPF